jgi:hypothetical protein
MEIINVSLFLNKNNDKFYCTKTENVELASQLIKSDDRNLAILHTKHEDSGIRMICQDILGTSDGVQ